MTAQAYDSRDWPDAQPPPGTPVTIRMVLFGDDPRAAVPRRGWGVMRDELSRVRADMRPVAERELAAAVAGLLEVDLGDAVRNGWRSHSRLFEAARATLAEPGSSEVVALATHRITASHTPYVDLIIDEVKASTVEVTIQVDIEVDDLVATVYNGQLVELHSGRCRVRATMFYANAELVTGTAVLDAPQSIALGQGFDLLGHEEQAPRADRGWFVSGG